jgi:putative phosphoribosyl transferase
MECEEIFHKRKVMMKNHRIFHSRCEAGEALAESLDLYRSDSNAIVMGLPGPGLVVAAAISDALNLPLDVFISLKLQAPCHAECMLGAITETGITYMDVATICAQNWLYRELRAYVERDSEVRQAEIALLRRLYRGTRNFPSVAGRRVILVAEGVTSGATFFAAVDSLRTLETASVIAAIPVGPSDVFREMHYKVDELVTLIRPEKLERVSDYYTDATEVRDDDAAKLLTEERRSRILKRAG